MKKIYKMALCVLCAHASNALAANFEQLENAVNTLDQSVDGLIGKYTQAQQQAQAEAAKAEQALQQVAEAAQAQQAAQAQAEAQVATEKQLAQQQVAQAESETNQGIQKVAVKIGAIAEKVAKVDQDTQVDTNQE